MDVTSAAPPTTTPPWSTGGAALAAALGVDPARGLDATEVARRQAQHGANELPHARRRPALALLVRQFREFMVLALIAAAVVSALIGDVTDSYAIAVIVLLDAAIGFAQEWRAEAALEALRRLASLRTEVLRAGERLTLDGAELVPGDVVLLEAGNAVPADLRLLEAMDLAVDESTLTGESVAVAKDAATLAATSARITARSNMTFKGTVVVAGRGRGLVVATGQATELGRIARLLERDPDQRTPLQQRLDRFGRRIAAVVLVLCAVVFTAGLMRGEPAGLMALTAISLAVAAIPEALPAVVTILLSLGARRMAAAQALVRRLPAVETLGSVTHICSDKTGTLTENRMAVDALWLDGAVLPASALAGDAPDLQALARAMALVNDSADGRGEPTELALASAARDAGVDGTRLAEVLPRIDELAFSSARRAMTTVHQRADGGLLLCSKGAPEVLLPRCRRRLADGDKAALDPGAIVAQASALAAQGLRVLAFAERRVDDALPEDRAAWEQDFTFLGLVGLLDPPRPEAAAAVAQCRSAGIVAIMITGDHPATARAIAARLGIAGPEDGVITGAELATLDDDALATALVTARVFARIEPEQKIRIVDALRRAGHFVAMTGDGVNDAPALVRADIGVAMGRAGTDVAREAASLVLLDDNFATIVAAVREGRRIYDNIRKFVRYTLTSNSAEILTILLAPLAGMPIPLLPIHILWINLVTDGLPGLALAAEPAARDTMDRPPRPPRESLFARGTWQHTLVIGSLTATLCLLVQAWALDLGEAHAQTMVFTVLTCAQMGHVLAIRSERESLFSLGLASNRPLAGAVLLTVALQFALLYLPPLNRLFGTVPLGAAELALCLALSAVPFLAVEAEKRWVRWPEPPRP